MTQTTIFSKSLHHTTVKARLSRAPRTQHIRLVQTLKAFTLGIRSHHPNNLHINRNDLTIPTTSPYHLQILSQSVSKPTTQEFQLYTAVIPNRLTLIIEPEVNSNNRDRQISRTNKSMTGKQHLPILFYKTKPPQTKSCNLAKHHKVKTLERRWNRIERGQYEMRLLRIRIQVPLCITGNFAMKLTYGRAEPRLQWPMKGY